MVGAVYFAVVFLACLLGAVAGLGGGVFIRPVFDALGYHGMADIQFFSSSAILAMAVVSTIKKVRDGSEIDKVKVALVSAGALLGGALGDLLLQRVAALSPTEAAAQTVQTAATVAMLLASLVLTAKSSHRFVLKRKGMGFVFGIGLGAVAVFLGVGGGPVNVPLLMIFFGLSMKTAAAYSIVIIFFSHLSRLVTTFATVGFYGLDLAMLLYIVPAAVLGGFAGARFSKALPDKTVKKMFVGAVSSVILLNIANGIFIF